MATLSYAHGTSDTPLLAETIGANLARAVAAHADRGALVAHHQDVRMTYAELDAEVNCVARGMPDERYGEEIAAFVILREGAELDAEGMREFCRGKIAHYKVPRYVIPVDGFR